MFLNIRLFSPSNETWSTMKHDNIKISETVPLYKSKDSNIHHSSTDYNDDLEESLDYIYAIESENNVVSKILQKEVAEMEKLNSKQLPISSEFDTASEPLVTSTTFTPKSIIATSLGEDKSGIIKILLQTISRIDNKVHEETILDPYETIPKFTNSFLPSSEKSITIIRDDYKFVDSLHVEKSELQHIDFSITDYTETTGDSVKSVSPIKCENDIITKSLTKNFGVVEHKTKASLLSEFDRQSKSVDLNTASKSVNSAQIVLRDDQETENATILQKPFSDTEHQVPLEVAEEQNVTIPEYSIISPTSESCVTIEHDDIKISETLPLFKSKASNIYQLPTDYSDDFNESLDYVSNTELETTVVSQMLQKDMDESEKLNIKRASISSELDIKRETVVTSTSFKPQSSIEALLCEDEGEILNILQETTSEIVNKVRAETNLDPYDTIPEFLHTLPLSEKSFTIIRDDCKVAETLQVEKSKLQEINFSNTDYAETVSESMKSVSPIKCEDDRIVKSSVGDFGEFEHLIKEPLLPEDHQQTISDDSVTESEPIKSKQVLIVEQVSEIAANLQEHFSGIEHPIPLEVTEEQNVLCS